jgi:hypothetical protein
MRHKRRHKEGLYINATLEINATLMSLKEELATMQPKRQSTLVSTLITLRRKCS